MGRGKRLQKCKKNLDRHLGKGKSCFWDSAASVFTKSMKLRTVLLVQRDGFNTAGPSANFTLYEWQPGPTSAGNMTVPGPAATTTGGNVPVNLSFSGLAPST
jgi:hypothetical protein